MLDAAITTCRAEEVATRQRSEITLPQSDAILAVRQKGPHHKKTTTQPSTPTCLGCGGEVAVAAQHILQHATTAKRMATMHMYAMLSKPGNHPILPARQIQLLANTEVESDHPFIHH